MNNFGRLYAPDTRDGAYRMRTSAFAAALVMKRYWPTGPTRDQGPYPSCVGFAGLHFLEAAPVMRRKGRQLPSGMDLYKGAQRLDEWPGENYAGTSARGLMKHMQELNLVKEYVWASNIEDVRNFVLVRGPVLVGTEWFTGMSNPMLVETGRHDGLYLKVDGRLEGGHEYLIVGYSRVRHAFRILNSWGFSWGEGGRAWIDFEAAAQLIFNMNGDAVSAVETI